MSDTMTRDEAAKIAEDAAERAVRKAVPRAVSETMLALGFDTAHPLEVQKTMAWASATRARCEAAGNKAFFTVLGLVVLGAIAAMQDGIVARLRALVGSG